ncbi:hypothetical protein K461DRAFT_110610 [Myriangium duriaei CBS 260.36]|uniref:Uncharacterized protein n=1 Tax=Myriangium duriaei CBS 260.36 TaxID=1168546 RepID=A0A9P4MHV5_9PEZI|nr:hypothetical protein K461DRAFT_110610 [Myriangium duriaei CBS 260.36]
MGKEMSSTDSLDQEVIVLGDGPEQRGRDFHVGACDVSPLHSLTDPHLLLFTSPTSQARRSVSSMGTILSSLTNIALNMGNSASFPSQNGHRVPKQSDLVPGLFPQTAVAAQLPQATEPRSELVSASPPRKRQRLDFSHKNIVDIEPRHDLAPLLTSTASFASAPQPIIQLQQPTERSITYRDVLAPSPPGMPLLTMTQFHTMVRRLGLSATITHPSREQGRASAAVVVNRAGPPGASGEAVYRTMTPRNYSNITYAREAACGNVITFLFSEEAKSRVGVARYHDLQRHMQDAADEVNAKVQAGIQQAANRQTNIETAERRDADFELSRKRSHLELDLGELSLDNIHAVPNLGDNGPRGDDMVEESSGWMRFNTRLGNRPHTMVKPQKSSVQQPKIQQPTIQEPNCCQTIDPHDEIEIEQEARPIDSPSRPILQPPLTRPSSVQPESWNQLALQAVATTSKLNAAQSMQITSEPTCVAPQPPFSRPYRVHPRSCNQPALQTVDSGNGVNVEQETQGAKTKYCAAPQPVFTHPDRLQFVSWNRPAAQEIDSTARSSQWQQIPGLPPMQLPSVNGGLTGDTRNSLPTPANPDLGQTDRGAQYQVAALHSAQGWHGSTPPTKSTKAGNKRKKQSHSLSAVRTARANRAIRDPLDLLPNKSVR